MVLTVAGLPAGASAVLVVEAPAASVVRTGDARCTANRERATCQVSGNDLSPLTLEVVAPQGAEVVASLTPAAVDPNLVNNIWRAPLA